MDKRRLDALLKKKAREAFEQEEVNKSFIECPNCKSEMFQQQSLTVKSKEIVQGWTYVCFHCGMEAPVFAKTPYDTMLKAKEWRAGFGEQAEGNKRRSPDET